MFVALGASLSFWIPALGHRVVRWHTYFFPRWTFGDLALVGVIFMAAVVGSGTLMLWSPAEGDAGHGVRFEQVIQVLGVGGTAALAAIAWRLHRREPEPWRAIGLHRAHALRSVGLALAGFPGVYLGVLGVRFLTLSVWAEPGAGEELMQPEISELFALDEGRWLLVAMYVVLLGPLIEEVVFRGFLQPWLVQNLGWNAGLVLTAAAFAGLHGPREFPVIFLLGLYLGWLARRTRSLWAPLAVHVLNNAVAVGLVWLMRDLLVTLETRGG